MYNLQTLIFSLKILPVLSQKYVMSNLLKRKVTFLIFNFDLYSFVLLVGTVPVQYGIK